MSYVNWKKWVASGRSPYDNGDYIYSENGCPMDFVSAMRFQDEMYEWWMSLSEEEREQELRELRGDYDIVSDSIIIDTEWSNPAMDPDAEYSCAMKSHFRKFGNQMSGSGNHLCNYASLLA